jgi:hypothetical protein
MIRPLLVVAMATSVHTVSWLHAARNGPRPLVLVPATSDPFLREVSELPRIMSVTDAGRLAAGEIGVWNVSPESWNEPPDDLPAPVGFGDRRHSIRGVAIAHAIRVLRPALVHSMEIQLAGYACLRAADLMGHEFPRWLVSSWGSDLFLYEKLTEHRAVLTSVARRADGLVCECHRDIAILRSLACGTRRLHVLPASGGAHFERLPMPSAPPSTRRDIVVKGDHGWSGRAIHTLSALHLAAPALTGFTIRVILANSSVADAAQQVARTSGLDIVIEPWCENHDRALERLARARLMVDIGISDGIGTTLLEAMALGAFPIVACTSCATEWVRPGTDAFVVDPHNVGSLAQALARAAIDDALVDAAAPRNRAVVERRWNARINRDAVLRIYESVLGDGRDE